MCRLPFYEQAVIDRQAEAMVLGQLLLNGAKRRDIEDAAYNRHTRCRTRRETSAQPSPIALPISHTQAVPAITIKQTHTLASCPKHKHQAASCLPYGPLRACLVGTTPDCPSGSWTMRRSTHIKTTASLTSSQTN